MVRVGQIRIRIIIRIYTVRCIRRIFQPLPAVSEFRISVYTPYFRIKMGCKTASQIVSPPDSGSNPSRSSPFCSLGSIYFPLLLLYLSIPFTSHFPLCFDARFCIIHNVFLVVRVLGLLFALEMAI
jgi:hypothetical protein